MTSATGTASATGSGPGSGPGRGAGRPAATAWLLSPRRFLLSEREIGLGILLAAAAAFLVVPLIDPTSPSALIAAPSQPPSWQHLFGTDQLGRDVFVRVWAAGRVDLGVTAGSVFVSLCAGTLAGLVISTLPAALRTLALRLVDAILAIPYLVLVLALAAALGNRQVLPGLPRGVGAIVIAVIIAGWAPYTRFTVASALALRERESVVAARLLGYGYLRILLRHIAPATLSTNLSYAAIQAVSTTGLVASLAFLGVGVPEPTPELGQMMQEGIALLPVAWWISIVPGIVIAVLGIGFGLIADSLGHGDAR